MTFFFLHHPVDTFRGRPGRYPFTVRAAALRRFDGIFRVEPAAERVVYADGVETDTPGPNVDPNVFAALLPWFLTFCNIGDDDSHRVRDLERGRPCPRSLGHIATRGDIVFFGSWLTNRIISVDTVVCVEACVPVPVQASHAKKMSFALKRRFGEYRASVAQHFPSFARVSWNEFVGSDDFLLNVIDSLSAADAALVVGRPRKTHHEKTELPDHRQIIGRTGEVPTEAGRTVLRDRFLAGEGFNFIPLRAPDSAPVHTTMARLRPGLLTVRTSEPHGLPKRGVSMLPLSLGTEILDRIFETAEALVFGRIEWLNRGQHYLRGAAR